MTQDDLNNLFDYRDGILFWAVNPPRGQKTKGNAAGSLWNSGYLSTRIKGKQYLNHRLIFMMHHGYFPKEIDHINGNKLDNRIDNLRDASHFDNTKNATIRADNKTGVKGVHFNKRRKKFHAYITTNRKRINLGFFDSLEDAKNVVAKARQYHHGEYANHGSI